MEFLLSRTGSQQCTAFHRNLLASFYPYSNFYSFHYLKDYRCIILPRILFLKQQIVSTNCNQPAVPAGLNNVIWAVLPLLASLIFLHWSSQRMIWNEQRDKGTRLIQWTQLIILQGFQILWIMCLLVFSLAQPLTGQSWEKLHLSKLIEVGNLRRVELCLGQFWKTALYRGNK